MIWGVCWAVMAADSSRRISIGSLQIRFYSLMILSGIGVGVIILNGWLHWRLHRGWHMSRRIAVGMSIADVVAITAGVAITGRFDNNFFVVS